MGEREGERVRGGGGRGSERGRGSDRVVERGGVRVRVDRGGG